MPPELGVDGVERAVRSAENDRAGLGGSRGGATESLHEKQEQTATCEARHENPIRIVKVMPALAGWLAPSELTGGVRKRLPWMRSASVSG